LGANRGAYGDGFDVIEVDDVSAREHGKLGLLDVICAASGAMISSGIFVLPGLAYALCGPSAIVAYLLAGLLALTGMLSQAELVSAMPKSGGTYFFVMRSMGPAVGAINGFVTWFSLSLKIAFALVGLSAFTHGYLGMDMGVLAALWCLFFVGLNIVGVKAAGRFQVVIVLVLIGILGGYVVGGLPLVDVHRLVPFVPHGGRAVLATAGFVFVSYGGLLKAAAISEEVDDGARTVPRGMKLALPLVMTLYLFVVFVTIGVFGGADLAESQTPLSDAAALFRGRGWRPILTVGALLAFISTANAGIMAASRYPFALARDELLPEVFGKVSKRFGTPHLAILVTGAFIISVVFMPLASLVKAASAVLILSFLFSCLSVIIMRESRLQNYQPRCLSPLYPYTQVVGIVGCTLLLVQMGAKVLAMAGALVLGGFLIYWLYGRIRSNRESALMHLVERLTSRDLTDHVLESELKEIIRQRDDITRDRFDMLVEASCILDLEGELDLDGLFDEVARALSERVGVSEAKLVKLLQRREKESSTVIGPGLAVPHIVLDGDELFDLLLVRCKGGVRFPETPDPVHAVFVLSGTRDQRNFHLRALSAICQIAQDLEFEHKWMASRNEEALRDLVLLGKRRRYGVEP
jgi:APA family basic amino acid/polyamine antiporter